MICIKIGTGTGSSSSLQRMSDLEVNSVHKYLFLCVAKNVQNNKNSVIY